MKSFRKERITKRVKNYKEAQNTTAKVLNLEIKRFLWEARTKNAKEKSP